MLKPTFALILLSAAAATSVAQPGPPPPPTPEPVGGVPSEPVQPPAVPPQPPQPPSNGGGAVHHDAGEAPSTGRPEGLSFGIGAGYTLPTSIQMPNTTSVRMRFASGLTIEPLVVLGNDSTKRTSGGVSTKDSKTEFSLGAVVRLPMVRHGKIELELLGGAGFGTVKNNPDGADNDVTTSSLGLTWGLACSYWITRHWNFTFSARNPLITYTKVTTQMMPPLMETTTATTSIGIDFAPTVSAMMHLYN
jgi:hypothetical protein